MNRRDSIIAFQFSNAICEMLFIGVAVSLADSFCIVWQRVAAQNAIVSTSGCLSGMAHGLIRIASEFE